jgi:hypothetical protein
VCATSELLAGAGLDDIAHRTASFRSGKGLVLRAEKRQAPPLQPESTLTTAPEQ